MSHSEHPQSPDTDIPSDSEHARRPWTPPVIRELPRLTDLTLQTGSGIPGGGGTGGGGSTVIP
ncbi:MAG TPA: hypothetical protein VNU46_06805 [Gemmatimonadaceae bacterium]|jgi:hypothetical protein|nr:hypothetical protein [Gemmatimonadaceae bacterium]